MATRGPAFRTLAAIARAAVFLVKEHARRRDRHLSWVKARPITMRWI
jgi:hypothetical protein